MEKVIGGINVEFQKQDNLELEKIFRLLLKKVGAVALAGGLDSDTEKTLDTLLDDKDFEKVYTVMLRTVCVSGVGMLDNRANILKLTDQYGLHMFYIIIWEAIRFYLGEHLKKALESGYIPPKLKKALTEFMQGMKEGRSFGELLNQAIATMQTQ